MPFYRCGHKKRDALASLKSGTDGNRTSDTRIFSPLLYQLSYGTSLLRLQKYDFFHLQQQKIDKKNIFFDFEILLR